MDCSNPYSWSFISITTQGNLQETREKTLMTTAQDLNIVRFYMSGSKFNIFLGGGVWEKEQMGAYCIN